MSAAETAGPAGPLELGRLQASRLTVPLGSQVKYGSVLGVVQYRMIMGCKWKRRSRLLL
jgi:hypothetical protein